MATIPLIFSNGSMSVNRSELNALLGWQNGGRYGALRIANLTITEAQPFPDGHRPTNRAIQVRVGVDVPTGRHASSYWVELIDWNQTLSELSSQYRPIFPQHYTIDRKGW